MLRLFRAPHGPSAGGGHAQHSVQHGRTAESMQRSGRGIPSLRATCTLLEASVFWGEPWQKSLGSKAEASRAKALVEENADAFQKASEELAEKEEAPLRRHKAQKF